MDQLGSQEVYVGRRFGLTMYELVTLGVCS